MENILVEIGPKDNQRYTYQWADDIYSISLISDTGLKRSNNEDRCIFSISNDKDIYDNKGLLVAVADGMGGAVAGEHASELAVKTLCDRYYSSTIKKIPEALLEAVHRANLEIYTFSDSNPDYYGMGSTLSAVAILGDTAYIAQVGDSRVYIHHKEKKLHQITNDHSVVAEQLREGLISKEDAKNHHMKNVITRALGVKESVEVDIFSLYLQKGDTILLCTDGLSNMVEDTLIQLLLDSDDLSLALNSLVEKAILQGGTDNITACAVKIKQTPPHYKLQRHSQMKTSNLYPAQLLLNKIFNLFRKQ